MRVADCRDCEYFHEARWSHRYEPKNFHAIGMTHVYGRCRKNGVACREVKKCDLLFIRKESGE